MTMKNAGEISDVREEFGRAMLERLMDKQASYGDVWKDVGVPYLRDRLADALSKWKGRACTPKEGEELVDIANIAMFLHYRLAAVKPPEKKVKKK
jgi:hypothetical protein